MNISLSTMGCVTHGRARRNLMSKQYSYRDYGNRIGFWRMLEVLDAYNITGRGERARLLLPLDRTAAGVASTRATAWHPSADACRSLALPIG
jgi:hypothetical protein